MKAEIRNNKNVIFCGTVRSYFWQKDFLYINFVGRIAGKNTQSKLSDKDKKLLNRISEATMKNNHFVTIDEGSCKDLGYPFTKSQVQGVLL